RCATATRRSPPSMPTCRARARRWRGCEALLRHAPAGPDRRRTRPARPPPHLPRRDGASRLAWVRRSRAGRGWRSARRSDDGGEALADPSVRALHLDPPAGFRINEGEETDRRELRVPWVGDVAHHDVVARREHPECPGPVVAIEEIGDDHHETATPRDP